jgi:Fe-S-cluster containining protein
MTLAEETRRHLAIFDEQLDRYVAHARAEGHSVPCRKGCAACCYDVVEVMHFELAALLEHLRTLPAETLAEIRARINAWYLAMLHAGIDPTGHGADLQTYARARVACPLLDPKRGECMVYASRPSSCRSYFIVDRPPSACANRAEVPTIQVLITAQIGLPIMMSLLKEYAAGRDEALVGRSMLAHALGELWPVVVDPDRSIEDAFLSVERTGTIEEPCPAK